MDPIRVSSSQVFEAIFRDEAYKKKIKNDVVDGILMGISIICIPFAICHTVSLLHELYKVYQITKERLQTPLLDMPISVRDESDQSVIICQQLRLNQMHRMLNGHSATRCVLAQGPINFSNSTDQTYLIAQDPAVPKIPEGTKHFEVKVEASQKFDEADSYLKVAKREKRRYNADAKTKGEETLLLSSPVNYTQVIDCPRDGQVFDHMSKALKNTMSEIERGKGNAIHTATLPTATRPYLTVQFVDPERGAEQVSFLRRTAAHYRQYYD